MRCAERAGGILDTCSDFSLIKHEIPEQSHSISGNGNLDVFTCASSSVPCSNPDCVTDVFGVSTSVFGGLRKGQ